MSRSYKNIRPKKHFVYTVEDLTRLFGVVPNTVSNWVKDGLKTSDDKLPYIFNGEEVKRFHDDRRQKNERKLRRGQFKCMTCKGRVFPEPQTVSMVGFNGGSFSFFGQCPDCGAAVAKRVNETDCDKILHCINTNTNLSSLDEGIESVQGGIVKELSAKHQSLSKPNDRILHEWLQFAGQWDQKTISAKLAAIRLLEDFCGGKAFSKLTKDDVVRFRDSLKESVEATAEGRLSISTVRHRASHLKSFLQWLANQKGYQGLNKSLPGYLTLPKRFDAAGLGERGRYVPTIAEAAQIVEGMSGGSIRERRDRAMVAIAFLAALRADTVTSLLVKHFEPATHIVVQDARSSRTKNGKSLRVKFFPVPEVFSRIVCDWKQELLDMDFAEEDTLFPEERYLAKGNRPEHCKAIPAMASTHAITNAFATASKILGKAISPHAAKHCIGTLSLEVCKTPEEHKAWSLNMGHKNEDVTVRYYKHLPDERVDEIFEQFDLVDEAGDKLDASDKDLMLRFHEHKLESNHPEYARIKQIVFARMRA